jgi:chemotaxis protein CheC
MTESPVVFNSELYKVLQNIAREGLHSAASGLSTMMGATLEVVDPSIKMIRLSQIQESLGGPENEAVGIYLKAEGDIAGHFMLIIPYDKAMELVDMLMELPNGTTKSLGSLERSALAEVGNLTTSFFLNSVASITGISAKPTPPAVMVDMIAAILDVIIAATGGITDQVMTFQANFLCGDRSVEAEFWVIPDPTTLDALVRRA